MKIIGYMSPGSIEILESLPLTGGAKVSGRKNARFCVPVVAAADMARHDAVAEFHQGLEAEALKTLWALIGAENQTEAVGMLKGDWPRKEWPVIPPLFSYGSVVQHRKGGYYEIVGTPARCRWEITGEPVYHYRALIDDSIWTRTQKVMEDGRFEKTGLSVDEAKKLTHSGGPYGEG